MPHFLPWLGPFIDRARIALRRQKIGFACSVMTPSAQDMWKAIKKITFLKIYVALMGSIAWRYHVKTSLSGVMRVTLTSNTIYFFLSWFGLVSICFIIQFNFRRVTGLRSDQESSKFDEPEKTFLLAGSQTDFFVALAHPSAAMTQHAHPARGCYERCLLIMIMKNLLISIHPPSYLWTNV